jgi:Zn-dependent peptidase ImmA (M78 family)
MIVSKSVGTPDETLEGAPGDKPDVLAGASPSRPLLETPVAMSRRGPGPFARLLHPHAKEARTVALDVDVTKVFSATDELRCERVSVPQAQRQLRDVVRVYEPAEQARPLDFSSVRFRERSPIPAKLESALRYTIADRMNRLMAVEAMLGARVVFRDPRGGAPAPATGAEVERAAAAVREAWGLGESPVPNLLGLLEEKGISVCEVGGFGEFDGLSAAFGSRTVIVVNPDVPADRVRFTAAHELAHVLGVAGAGPETAEGLCHEFAGAFLLPRGPLARLMTPAGRKVALADLAELKRTYGVSLQAIMRRAHALGLATDRQLRRFRETFKDRGWYEVEPVEYRGTEKAVRFRRLLNFAVAEDILDLERAAALAGVAPEELKKDMGDIF